MIPLLGDVRTKDEKDLLRDQVGELEAALFRSDPHAIEKILSSHLPEDLAAAMRKIIQDPVFKDNPEALKKFFQDLRDTLDKLSVLKLAIAFKQTEELVAQLHAWTDKNLGHGVVLDISYDGSMVGGAKIIFGGRYKEVTLAQIITDALVKEKTVIMRMFKSK